jgi:hypothetical protein
MKDRVNIFVDRFPSFHALESANQVVRLIYFHVVEEGQESANVTDLKLLFRLANVPVPKNLPKLLAYLCGAGAKLISDHGEFTLRREVRRTIEQELGAAKSTVTFIDPAQAFGATLSLHDYFSKLEGLVRVCDAYLDSTTLEHLHAVDTTVPVKLLTKNVKDSGELRRLAAAWKAEGRTLEIRVDNSAPLHDRYVIDDVSMLILGTSLNGFGKKQCFVVKAGPDIRSVLTPAFDTLWAGAAPWP